MASTLTPAARAYGNVKQAGLGWALQGQLHLPLTGSSTMSLPKEPVSKKMTPKWSTTISWPPSFSNKLRDWSNLWTFSPRLMDSTTVMTTPVPTAPTSLKLSWSLQWHHEQLKYAKVTGARLHSGQMGPDESFTVSMLNHPTYCKTSRK